MALIPADVGLRMRLDNELLPQQITPVQEIAADLPRLQAGQVFTAQIREVLPQNTYLALVAGKTVTLSLPESVKSGDVLDLVVVDQTPKTITARLANQPAAGADAGEATTPHTTLSQTGQMLRSLLVNDGETPAPAPLNRGQPLLAQPPQSGAELVPVLSKAVSESGLFYEAHQAQWVAGKLPLANLRQEPQGQQPVPAASVPQPTVAVPSPLPVGLAAEPAASPTTPTTPFTPPPAMGANPPTAPQTLPGVLIEGERPASTNTAAQPQTPSAPEAPPPPTTTAVLNKAVVQGILLYQANQAQEANLPAQHTGPTPASHAAGDVVAAQPKETAPPASAAPGTATAIAGHEDTREAAQLQAKSAATQMQAMPTLPDDLRALVQQQLDAAGTQRLLWHGEVWPGQTMQWQLEWQGQGGGNGSEEAAEPWQTKLRLSTPRLGELEASLQLGVAGVRIALNTANATTAADMRAGAVNLENSLAAAGVPLLGLTVKQTQEDQEETGDGQATDS